MSMFPSRDFTNWTETDVRETVIVPILRKLGYEKGTSNDCITEQVLRYPRISIGRKKPNDPSLRGKADYILEVDGRLRWVIEAKSPSQEISLDEREQAYTYASHPEVKAIFYLVTNGRNFEIYQTLNGPNAAAILQCSYEELSEKFQTISNVLSPDSLKREFKAYVLDVGIPLAPGLRSFAKFTDGKMVHRTCLPAVSTFNLIGMTAHLTEGSIERTSSGLLCYFKTVGPYDQLNEWAQALGLEVTEMVSTDETLSSNPLIPSQFSGNLEWVVPRGTSIPDVVSNRNISAPLDIRVRTEIFAKGTLSSGKFSGTYALQVRTAMSGFGETNVSLTGDFDVRLS